MLVDKNFAKMEQGSMTFKCKLRQKVDHILTFNSCTLRVGYDKTIQVSLKGQTKQLVEITLEEGTKQRQKYVK